MLAQALARCLAQVLQPIRHCFHSDIPNWTTSCHHTKSGHGVARSPSQRSRPPRHWRNSANWAKDAWCERCPKDDCKSDCAKGKCSFNSVVGLPHCARHRRTHHVASNLAGTGAPSTNNHEIDVFCCSVDGPTRPVSCHVTPCWTWNQSDVEEKCQCASLSSVRTTLKTLKEVTHHHMLFKQAQLKTTPKGNGVALERDNMFV